MIKNNLVCYLLEMMKITENNKAARLSWLNNLSLVSDMTDARL